MCPPHRLSRISAAALPPSYSPNTNLSQRPVPLTLPPHPHQQVSNDEVDALIAQFDVAITPSEAAAGDESEEAASGDQSEEAASGDVSEEAASGGEPKGAASNEDTFPAPATPGRFYLYSACHRDIVFAHENGFWDDRKLCFTANVGDTLVLRYTKKCLGLRKAKYFCAVGIITHNAVEITDPMRIDWPSTGHPHLEFDAERPYRRRIVFTPSAVLETAVDDPVRNVTGWGWKTFIGKMRHVA